MVLWQSLRFDQLANKVVGVVIWMITDDASSATAIAGHYYVSVIEIACFPRENFVEKVEKTDCVPLFVQHH
jgi:hypothetical protein